MNEHETFIADLKQKRDELRVQMHLASKELQQDWDELEEKMDDFCAKAEVRKTGEGLGKALGQLGDEVKLGYARILKAVKKS